MKKLWAGIGGSLFLLVLLGYQHLSLSSLPAELAEKACPDAYNSPGYIYRPLRADTMRWIPYRLKDLEGRHAELSETTLPALDALADAPPSFNDWLAQARDLPTSPELSFMRNRTILTVGDSHDRRNIEGFCALHKGVRAQLLSTGFHVASRCIIPSLNFTVSSWYHYGLAEPTETWYRAGGNPLEDAPPYSIESRLEMIFKPNLALTGPPDLIILSSNYWDVRYPVYHAEHEGFRKELQTIIRPLAWNELAWHRSRQRDYVELFQESFPGVPLMMRLAHFRANNTDGGNVAHWQMNESTRSLMAYLNIPLFSWGALIRGEENYVDIMHVKGAPWALWSDMVLYYLRRAVEGCS